MDITPDKLAEVAILARDLPAKFYELEAFIDDMTVDEQVALVALFWIGRGAFDPNDWDEAVITSAEEATTAASEYLMGSPHLADHIEAGMEAMGLDAAAEELELYRVA